jgi:glutamate synthase (NADPH/NADH) large chain/glutamate synthase (ferredoxin)
MGFATAPLVASGCVMMRACHLNTCPVGIATQDPVLRERFAGKPEHVVNFFFFIAEEVRGLMARLGIARFDDLVGRVDLLDADEAVSAWRERGVDLANILHVPEGAPLRRTHGQAPALDGALDWSLLDLDEGEFPIRNVNRTVGGLLSYHAVKKGDGRPQHFLFRGSAGQSFGAWLAEGIELTLVGDANDYVGKGLSGGVLALRPPESARFRAEENVIAGNTILYGATSGRAFFRGLVGERFAVRNSGASAVVEGVGDHGCEYMTGGIVVVLGPTGRNFAAGMSGGIAYVLDRDGTFAERCNKEMVALEELEPEDLGVVRALVDEHRERTGSTIDVDFEAFVKVMPHEFRRALADGAVSTGGDGFFTRETEEAAA